MTNRLLGLILFFSCAVSSTLSADGFVEIKEGSPELLKILESLPYASEGEGPVMYTFEFSECAYCQAKYRDFQGKDLGLEYRRFFVPVSERAARETAALALSRSAADYHAYMTGRKHAPQFTQNNAAIDAHNQIVTAVSETIPPILIKNGWEARGLVFPAYFWIQDGKVFANGGYLKSNFEKAVAQAKSGWNEKSQALLASVSGETNKVAGGSSEGAATTGASADAAIPLDELTVFFVYHKLSGEPMDFDRLAQNAALLVHSGAHQRAQYQAAMAQELRSKYEATDPNATYVIAVGATLNYQKEQERFSVDTFGPGMMLPFDAPSLRDPQLGIPRRLLTFANAESARYIPLPATQAQQIDTVAQGYPTNVVAEVHFKFADAVTHRDERQKQVRAQVSAVRYSPGAGAIKDPRRWPLNEPVAVKQQDLPSLADMAKTLDDALIYLLYHKVTGTPLNVEAIAAATEAVRLAAQFDKETRTKAEAERLARDFEATDPKATYMIRVGTRMVYEMDKERFRVEIFEPGRFIRYHVSTAMAALGVSDRRAIQAIAPNNEQRLVFAVDEATRYIPLPRDAAGAIEEVHRTGALTTTAEMELAVIGAGDPTGAVQSDNTLRMAVKSIRLHPRNAAAEAAWPFTDAIKPAPFNPANDPPKMDTKLVDIMGLKPGGKLSDLQKTIEQKFGAVSRVNKVQNEDARLVSGIGHAAGDCYSFGNKVPEAGKVCISAFADEKGIVRKIIVDQVLEGTDWPPIREALVAKYGAVADSVSRGNNLYYAWGSEVAESITADDPLAPKRALSARLSSMQSAMDRMAASTRASTSLRIRLIDAEWAGGPEATPKADASETKPPGVRL